MRTEFEHIGDLLRAAAAGCDAVMRRERTLVQFNEWSAQLRYGRMRLPDRVALMLQDLARCAASERAPVPGRGKGVT